MTKQVINKVGVIGGGQLAWMMGKAANNLGVELIIQTPKKDDPAVSISSKTILAPVADAFATAELADLCDVITFENEFVDLKALSLLEQKGVCFRPGLGVLAPLLDKYEQRCFFQSLGLKNPDFFTLIDPDQSTPSVKYPLVIKARRHGYDGQGTFVVYSENELYSCWAKMGDRPIIVEEFIPFVKELAVMVARSTTGEIVVYPVVETQQENQVCRRVLVTTDIDDKISQEIQEIARNLVTGLKAIGIFGIELFLTAKGEVIINEIAPRTHNSGHYTIEACETSQFSQHLQAVCGLELGAVNLKCKGAVMVNLLGFETSVNDYQEKRAEIAKISDCYVHWYGKTASRPGRKLGHVTILSEDGNRDNLLAIAQKVEKIWYGN
jgi:5-(carboxyamino)imidazole ribonucleotide synthase